MGFDVHGKQPKIIGEKPEIDWGSNPSDAERDKYFEDQDKYHLDNPGVYFRNNVWYWRPLWSYICSEVAPTILSEKDKQGGDYNDHHLINAVKAIYIADKIEELDAAGELEAFAIKYVEGLDALPKEKCPHCNGTGIRNDVHVKGKCNACKDGMKESWAKSYPFDTDNVREFARFARASGGFEIG